MTSQINDIFRYHGAEYAVAGISDDGLFHPAVFGLQPVMASTACWRGYQAIFGLSDAHLILDALHVRLGQEGEEFQPAKGPAIHGVEPAASREERDLFNNHYTGLNHRLAYTGGLLLAAGFIRDLYVHMGFQSVWKYETVIELVFEKGTLTAEFDRSERLAEMRHMILESRDERGPAEGEIRDFIRRAFDRTYSM